MSRSNELRKLVKTYIATLSQGYDIKEIYYKEAADNAMYPHVVFSLEELTVLSDDNNRKDYTLEVHVWDKGQIETRVLEIADAIEELFNVANLPQSTILPTFFFRNRTSVIDEDKKIQHERIRFQVQLYNN